MNHSAIGASTCERFWNCPGSVALIKKAPEQESSKYAQEGTAAHAVGAGCLLAEDYTSGDWIGEVVELEDCDVKVTENMSEAVDLYLTVIKMDMKRFPGAILGIEQEFTLPHIHKNARGTNDANLHVPFERLIIYDYKYGAGVAVDVEDNKQLLYYASGAVQGLDVEEVELVIVQPRAEHHSGSKVRRVTISMEELRSFEAELKIRVAAALKAKAKLSAGKHCRFCPAMAICPEARKAVEETAMTDFKGKPLPDANTLSVQQVRGILDNTFLLEEFIKAVQAHAHHLAESGEEIPGYKLVKKKSNRAWIDATLAEAEFEVYGDEIYTEPKLKSPAQLEKIVGKKRIEEFVHKPDTGTALVLVTDRREPVKAAAISDFSEEL